MKARIRYLYLPFLIMSVTFVISYGLFDRFFIETGLLPIDDDLAGIWLPLAAPWVPILIWLRPRIALLNLQIRQRNYAGLYLFLASVAMAVPSSIEHRYLETAVGNLTHVKDGSQIGSSPASKYYSADALCLQKNAASAASEASPTGKRSETLVIRLYIVAPICDSPGVPISQGARSVWIGRSYHTSISNSTSEDEKNAAYKTFYEESVNTFNQENSSTYTYLEQPGASADRRGLQEALKKNSRYETYVPAILLVPHFDRFEERNGKTLEWSLGSFAIGAVVWLCMILMPPINEAMKSQLESGAMPQKAGPRQSLLSILIPTRRQYALAILLDINILVFVAMVFSGLGFLSFRSSDLITWGGNYGPELRGFGVIRLLTSQFVHGGLMHVANNMYALLFAGALLLPVLGNVRLLGAYLISGLGGSSASAWMHPEIVSVGASGAIFGLFGVLLARVVFKDEQAAARRQAILINVALFVALNLAIGFTSPGIDNAAHIGGLATGLVLGVLLHMTKGQNSANGDPSEPA